METKQILLCAVFISLFAQSLFSQDYTPFEFNNSEWIVSSTIPTMGPGEGAAVWKFNTRGDTILDSKDYKIVTQTDLCKHLPDRQTGERIYSDIDPTEYKIGAIREEDKRVYYYDFKEGEEVVLYDFNLEVGDTIFYGDKTKYVIILEKHEDSPTWYKIANSTEFAYPYVTGRWVEGQGSSYGLLGPLNAFLNSLECTSFGSDPAYDYACGNCEGYTITSSSDPDIGKTLKVFPNPVSSNLYIEIPDHNVERVQLFSVAGELKLEVVGSNGLNHISTDRLAPGTYLSKIILDNGTSYNRRIIVVRE